MGKSGSRVLIKYFLKRGAKKASRLVLKAGATVLMAVGWPALVIAVFILLAVVIVGAVYSALPGSGLLTGATPSELDQKYRIEAAQMVQKWNVQETWLVGGEGSWYPQKGELRLGKLCDRYGRDAVFQKAGKQ